MTQASLVRRRSGLICDKILRRHQDRLAIVYVRQSTVQQVERHQESTRLQYGLADRASQYGWEREQIVVIDDDLGRSGASVEGRLGFQRLVAEVGLGNVGLVLGIEMSRLARSCRDWHQLLEICALFDTLIADTDGVYDPANYNDRLLLGLKGTMSEAELHILKARMLAGRKAKAGRGELGKPVPMGYVRHPSGEAMFDPDEQAQTTIRLVFELFDKFKTIGKVMTYLVEHEIRMPVRLRGGPQKGDLEWRRVSRASLHDLFANPIYAGVYAYGVRAVEKRRQKPGRPGTGRRSPRARQAEVFLHDCLPAYISFERYQLNQAQLQSNRAAWGGAPKAGTALLSGLLVCGRCGLRMQAQYNNNGHTARYVCQTMKASYGDPFCQSLKAKPLDDLIGRLVLEAMAPAAIEASVALAKNLEAERAALDHHWRQRRERAGYEVERARRQYAAVEPENRLVARTLERAWEAALSDEAQLAAEYERFKRTQAQTPSAAELTAVRELTHDLPALWRAETTTQAERQTLARLLLERVLVEVVGSTEKVRVECHWQGGSRTPHELTRPVARLATLSTYAALTARAAELRSEGLDCAQVADILNSEGWRPAKRRDTFNAPMVHHLLIKSGVETVKYRRRPSKIERRPSEWTIRELAEEIGMPQPTLYAWIQKGRLSCRNADGGSQRAKLVLADPDTVSALKTIRATPPPWRRIPPRTQSTHPSPTTES
jgi:DNA invertase Pin-like site-specific DNA recombinase